MARRAVATAPSRRANGRPQVPFVYKLALNQWLLSLFNVRRFEELARASAQREAGRDGREQPFTISIMRSRRSCSISRSSRPNCCSNMIRISSNTHSA